MIIFERHANLKYKYSNRNFWCRGYFVSTVGKSNRVIQEYIRNQVNEDISTDQITMKEFENPFKDSK